MLQDKKTIDLVYWNSRFLRNVGKDLAHYTASIPEDRNFIGTP
jgi:hypothetical protein